MAGTTNYYASKAWLWEVYQHTRSVSQDSLFTYFRGQTRKNDLTPDIMNMVNTAVKAVFPADDPGNSCCSLHPQDSHDWVIDKAQCATYLYYKVAEHMLQQTFPHEGPAVPEGAVNTPAAAGTGAASRRFKGMIKVCTSPACHELVCSQEFHLPLVECALQLVAHVTAQDEHDQQYQWVTQLLQRQGHAACLWQAARSFQECFGPDSAFALPPQLHSYLLRVQSGLLDSSALATGSQLFSIIDRGGGCHFKEGDSGLVDNLLKAYAQQAVHRAQLVGWTILQQQHTRQQGSVAEAASQQSQQQLPSQQQQLPDSFPEQCAWLMDKLLLGHLNLCFGQHMSVVVGCAVYIAAKVMQVNLTFKRVTEAIITCVDQTHPEVFQQAEVRQPQLLPTPLPAEYGDVRMFYNARFLPSVEGSVRQYLQEYTHGQCSEQLVAAPVATRGVVNVVPGTSTAVADPKAALAKRTPFAGLDGNRVAASLMPWQADNKPTASPAKPSPVAAVGSKPDQGAETAAGQLPPWQVSRLGLGLFAGLEKGEGVASSSIGGTPTRHMR